MDQSDFCIHLSNHHFAVASSAGGAAWLKATSLCLSFKGDLKVAKLPQNADMLCGDRTSTVGG